MIKILAIPGSLRSGSSSNYILHAVVNAAHAGVTIDVYNGIAMLPHFNDPPESPKIVSEFRTKIREADAVLICTPEYAFGIPGSLKNALDWTVSSGDFMDKPVAVVTASSQGEKGHAALLLVLTALSGKIINESSMVISFVRAKLDASGNVNDFTLQQNLERVIPNLLKAIPAKLSIL